MELRRPTVAGQFYEGTEEALRAQIEASFTSELGPGHPPENPGSTADVVGVVVPHAGYVYSGPVAAWSYSALYSDRKPGTFVILGPNHHGMGSLISLYPDGAWQTPLGSAAIDADLARTILQGTSIIDSDRRAHTYEHSIEVQVPFLQYLYGDVRIVPVSMSLQDFETSAEVGKDIGKAIISSGTDAAVVASTDFSHYVSRDVAHENDHAAIERIVAMDPRGLYDVVQDRRISMCGYGPVMAAIAASKLLGGSRGELLKYGTSGDVTPMRDVVGYAALAFRRG